MLTKSTPLNRSLPTSNGPSGSRTSTPQRSKTLTINLYCQNIIVNLTRDFLFFLVLFPLFNIPNENTVQRCCNVALSLIWSLWHCAARCMSVERRHRSIRAHEHNQPTDRYKNQCENPRKNPSVCCVEAHLRCDDSARTGN